MSDNEQKKQGGPPTRKARIRGAKQELRAIRSGEREKELTAVLVQMEREEALAEAKLGRQARRLVQKKLEAGDVEGARTDLTMMGVRPTLVATITAVPSVADDPPAPEVWGPTLVAVMLAQPGAGTLRPRLRGYLAEAGVPESEIDTLIPSVATTNLPRGEFNGAQDGVLDLLADAAIDFDALGSDDAT